MERAGLPLKDMQVQQQQLAYALLNSALSHRGYSKALNIMALEQILHDLESSGPTRDPSLYSLPDLRRTVHRTPPGAGASKAITCRST